VATVLETHIEIDERGVPWIARANTKVIEVALDRIAEGWSPEEFIFSIHTSPWHKSTRP
jgi:hypothetical protein